MELRRRRGGVFVSRGRNVPQVTLTLRRRDARGRAHLNLRLTRIHTRDVRALCAVLPARIAIHPADMRFRLVRGEVERFLAWAKDDVIARGANLLA